jgi:hypothetical protein
MARHYWPEAGPSGAGRSELPQRIARSNWMARLRPIMAARFPQDGPANHGGRTPAQGRRPAQAGVAWPDWNLDWVGGGGTTPASGEPARRDSIKSMAPVHRVEPRNPILQLAGTIT